MNEMSRGLSEPEWKGAFPIYLNILRLVTRGLLNYEVQQTAAVV